MPSFAGKVALVTGGARGIGQAIARRFADAGATVVVGDIDGDRLVQIGLGASHRTAVLDVTDPDRVSGFIGDAIDAFGRIDVVVNNAGLVNVSPLLDLDIEVWRRVFAVNVEGCLNVTQAAARVMIGQPADQYGCRGRIINVSSPAAEFPRPLLAAYGASKAAINHLSRSAAAALGPDGVWVMVLYPTNVEEGMWRSLPDDMGAASGRSREEIVAERLATAPTGRFQTAAEVADMALYAATAPGLNAKLLWTEAHVADL